MPSERPTSNARAPRGRGTSRASRRLRVSAGRGRGRTSAPRTARPGSVADGRSRVAGGCCSARSRRGPRHRGRAGRRARPREGPAGRRHAARPSPGTPMRLRSQAPGRQARSRTARRPAGSSPQASLGVRARRLPRVRLPLEERRRPLPRPRDLENGERRDGGDGERRTAPPTRTIDAATAIARSGARKIRCPDSGAAEPPSFATTNAAVPSFRRATARAPAHGCAAATPTGRDEDDAERHRPPSCGCIARRAPEVAEDAAGTAELSPPPPTPTSNLPASTRSVSQNGIPRTSTMPPAIAAPRRRSRAATSTYAA